jgi:hypothetical protein
LVLALIASALFCFVVYHLAACDVIVCVFQMVFWSKLGKRLKLLAYSVHQSLRGTALFGLLGLLM